MKQFSVTTCAFCRTSHAQPWSLWTPSYDCMRLWIVGIDISQGGCRELLFYTAPINMHHLHHPLKLRSPRIAWCICLHALAIRRMFFETIIYTWRIDWAVIAHAHKVSTPRSSVTYVKRLWCQSQSPMDWCLCQSASKTPALRKQTMSLCVRLWDVRQPE